MSKYADIIKRLEKAMEPSRELDCRVAYATDIQVESMGISLRRYVDIHDRDFSEVAERSDKYNSILRTELPRYTASLDASIALVDRVLPGWGWRVATCCVSDDAFVFADFNSPEYGERLLETVPTLVDGEDWSDFTDIDQRPPGRPAIALLRSMFIALEALEAESKP
jgi:hypothetical protein